MRDGSGNLVPKAKVEVFGATKQDRLPTAFQNYFTGGHYFVGFMMYGCAYPGDFRLRVSAEGFQSYERPITFTGGLVAWGLTLPPEGSPLTAQFETLATLRGQVIDQHGREFSGAQIEAKNALGKVYQETSNRYGYYTLDLPSGVYTVRVTGTEIAPVIFENHKIQDKYVTLDISTCRNCRRAK